MGVSIMYNTQGKSALIHYSLLFVFVLHKVTTVAVFHHHHCLLQQPLKGNKFIASKFHIDILGHPSLEHSPGFYALNM